uniref:NBS-LRR disease resistance protein family-3 n=1 Tax=Oryza ridleyi TaxID=83308 RepID=E0CWC6_9ORYZ|nr:NBS-LRR disease resistance protein family-3 [Oryza ridleyi]
MGELGFMLAGAVLSSVGQQISSVILGQIMLQWDFNDDLKKMKATLDSVTAVLEDAEKQSIKEASVRRWLKNLKDAAYDISDMIDEFDADTQGIQPAEQMSTLKKGLLQLATMVPCLTVGPKIKLTNKMKALRQQLKEIKYQRSFLLNTSPSVNGLNIPDERATSSTVDKTVIVGRNEEIKTIIKSLSKSMVDDFTVFPIYGIGGIGKTTLAKMVYSDTLFKDYSRVWVYVSQIFDSNKIGNSIISQLSEEESQLTEQQMIHTRLANLLAEKKVLIVLDDLWEDEGSRLDKLKDMLKVGEGSKQTARMHYYDDVTLLTMHDLVHDLARSVMADEILDSSTQDNANKSSCRYALLNDCTKPLESYIYSPANIKALRFLNCWKLGLHDDTFSSAKHIRVLDLSECCIQKLPDSIGHLKQLRYLNAPGVQDDRIPDCITKLLKLMYLRLRGSYTILALPESIGEMEGLVKGIPEAMGGLTKLQFLNLSNCHNIFEDGLHIRTKISGLENVKSIEEVQLIKLKKKQKLDRLELRWSGLRRSFVDDMELLGELVPPISLRDIDIVDCVGTKLPAWLTDIARYLPNLVCVTLRQLGKCSSLPPLGRLPNLEKLTLAKMHGITKIGVDFCGGPRAFPQLKEFYLHDMGGLELWNTTFSYSGDVLSEFMFPKLQKLEIYWCDRLTLTPHPPRVEKWDIKHSDMVLSSWGESAPDTVASCSSPTVTALNVQPRVNQYYPRLPLREWRLLNHLPHLNGLKITDCIDLTISAEIIGALSSLQSLALLNDHGNIQLLPDWSAQLTPLKELVISGYEMKESQEGISYPTPLQALALSRCQNMTAMLNSKLKISGCNGIKSLPDGIQELTKLEHLEISRCPELKKWCELEVNQRKLAHVEQKKIYR